MQPECPFLPTLRHILVPIAIGTPGIPWLDKKFLFSCYTKNPFIMSNL